MQHSHITSEVLVDPGLNPADLLAEQIPTGEYRKHVGCGHLFKCTCTPPGYVTVRLQEGYTRKIVGTHEKYVVYHYPFNLNVSSLVITPSSSVVGLRLYIGNPITWLPHAKLQGRFSLFKSPQLVPLAQIHLQTAELRLYTQDCTVPPQLKCWTEEIDSAECFEVPLLYHDGRENILRGIHGMAGLSRIFHTPSFSHQPTLPLKRFLVKYADRMLSAEELLWKYETSVKMSDYGRFAHWARTYKSGEQDYTCVTRSLSHNAGVQETTS